MYYRDGKTLFSPQGDGFQAYTYKSINAAKKESRRLTALTSTPPIIAVRRGRPQKEG